MIEWLATIDKLEYQVLVVGAWLTIVALAALVTERLTPKGTEFVRKVVHIGTGQVILLAWWMPMPPWVGITAAIGFSGVSILSYHYPILPSIHNIGRKTWGTCFYAISIGVLIALFWPIGQPRYAVLGILVMAWGDGLAGLIGRRFGRHRYTLWGSQKSWEGSTTMAIVSAIVTFAVLWPTGGALGHGSAGTIGAIALAVGCSAAALETWGKLGVDNLTVPIGSAAIAYGLMQMT
jgi:phytol kinase